MPAVTGEPPLLDDGVTGDPLFCRAWTLLGVPALAVPGPRGSPAAHRSACSSSPPPGPTRARRGGRPGGRRARLSARVRFPARSGGKSASKRPLGGEMSHGTETDADRVPAGLPDGRRDEIDWERIERSPEFRELTSRRHRFIAVAATITLRPRSRVYLGARDLRRRLHGDDRPRRRADRLARRDEPGAHDVGASRPSTCAADREFGPLEARVRERAGARFTRDGRRRPGGTADARTAPAAATTNERSAR